MLCGQQMVDEFFEFRYRAGYFRAEAVAEENLFGLNADDYHLVAGSLTVSSRESRTNKSETH